MHRRVDRTVGQSGGTLWLAHVSYFWRLREVVTVGLAGGAGATVIAMLGLVVGLQFELENRSSGRRNVEVFAGVLTCTRRRAADASGDGLCLSGMRHGNCREGVDHR